MEKVILIYSGGLDTSICIPFAKEKYGLTDLVTVTIDVGQPRDDIETAAEKAKILGTEHYTVDAKDDFVVNYCWKALKANGSYEGYPLSTAIARPLIAEKAVEVATRLGAKTFIHGCTGKGNDQFRIEFGIRSLMPDARIIAPIREHNMTRTWEIEYGKKHGVPLAQSLDKIWSVDENLWGRSIEGGRLEEPDFAPPEEIFQWTKGIDHTPNTAQNVVIDFENGVPVKVNGEPSAPHMIVAKCNAIAGMHGIGRIDIMEDRMLGIKVRENYECPAATLLLLAHKALEALVLTADELQFKATVDQRWSELAYRGLWHDPLKVGLETFIDQCQTRVSGSVTLRLHRGNMVVVARQSPWSLYQGSLASFDTQDFDQRESTGTVKNFGLQAHRYWQVKKANAERGIKR